MTDDIVRDVASVPGQRDNGVARKSWWGEEDEEVSNGLIEPAQNDMLIAAGRHFAVLTNITNRLNSASIDVPTAIAAINDQLLEAHQNLGTMGSYRLIVNLVSSLYEPLDVTAASRFPPQICIFGNGKKIVQLTGIYGKIFIRRLPDSGGGPGVLTASVYARGYLGNRIKGATNGEDVESRGKQQPRHFQKTRDVNNETQYRLVGKSSDQ